MSIFRAYETDQGLVEKGIWADLGEDGGEWLLAHAGETNKGYAKAMALKLKPYAVQIDAGVMPSEKMKKLIIETWADWIVLDWSRDGHPTKDSRAIRGDDEEPLPFSKENVVMVLERAPALFARLSKIAADHQNFLKAQLEQAAKNSPSVSSGS